MDKIKVLENLNKEIESNNLKITEQRRTILDVLFKSRGNHLTVDEIWDLCKIQAPAMGISTVYRTVLEFDKIGIIYKIKIFGGSCKYHLILPSESKIHRHFICTNCGNVIDIDFGNISQAEKEIENRYNVNIESQSSNYYGLCSECSSN